MKRSMIDPFLSFDYTTDECILPEDDWFYINPSLLKSENAY